MTPRFEELDWRQTAMGELSLRRRRDPLSGADIYEVKLDDDFLMSSMFTVAEQAVARLALDRVVGDALDVVVGGLGLGFTALTVLDDPRVRSLLVVDRLPEIIQWHQQGLIPMGEALVSDPRCRFVEGDFFAMAAEEGFDPLSASRQFDAVVLDVDHSPRHLLHPSHAAFYEEAGMARLGTRIRPGGVFSLWSNDPPDSVFMEVLSRTFIEAEAIEVSFPNPLQGGSSANTVYVANVPDVPTGT